MKGRYMLLEYIKNKLSNHKEIDEMKAMEILSIDYEELYIILYMEFDVVHVDAKKIHHNDMKYFYVSSYIYGM